MTFDESLKTTVYLSSDKLTFDICFTLNNFFSYPPPQCPAESMQFTVVEFCSVNNSIICYHLLCTKYSWWQWWWVLFRIFLVNFNRWSLQIIHVIYIFSMGWGKKWFERRKKIVSFIFYSTFTLQNSTLYVWNSMKNITLILVIYLFRVCDI